MLRHIKVIAFTMIVAAMVTVPGISAQGASVPAEECTTPAPTAPDTNPDVDVVRADLLRDSSDDGDIAIGGGYSTSGCDPQTYSFSFTFEQLEQLLNDNGYVVSTDQEYDQIWSDLNTQTTLVFVFWFIIIGMLVLYNLDQRRKPNLLK